MEAAPGTTIDLSVVIVNWNGRSVLPTTLGEKCVRLCDGSCGGETALPVPGTMPSASRPFAMRSSA